MLMLKQKLHAFNPIPGPILIQSKANYLPFKQPRGTESSASEQSSCCCRGWLIVIDVPRIDCAKRHHIIYTFVAFRRINRHKWRSFLIDWYNVKRKKWCCHWPVEECSGGRPISGEPEKYTPPSAHAHVYRYFLFHWYSRRTVNGTLICFGTD